MPGWKFTAQLGYFTHDNDPESWDFRATTLPRLGLLERTFPNQDLGNAKEGIPTWSRFKDHIKYLNQEDPKSRCYKMFYIIRHGEGIHNVKEQEVGRKEWDRYWAKQPGDGMVVWEDAELVARGEQQAADLARFWMDAFDTDKIPRPQAIYTSPLRRCLKTTALVFEPILQNPTSKKPMIKEKLRERHGVHRCDKRSTRSWIAEAYPEFIFEAGFKEEDELWKEDRRETLEEHIQRSTELLEDIFEHDQNEFITLVAHSGAIMALFAATGWKKIPVKAGSAYPLFVAAEQHSLS